MKFCEKEKERTVYRDMPPGKIPQGCNKVKCIDRHGNECECWLTYPKDEYHNRNAEIIIDERRDNSYSAVYYGLSAIVMGTGGVILFFVLWAQEAGLFA